MRSYADPERSLPGQLDPLSVAYDDEERQEAAVRALTLREHSPAVSEWLFALELFAFAFAPDREFNTGAVEEDRVPDGAYALRLQLLALSGRSAKPALDLLVAGYYTEAWALLRSMLEGWARCVYVRLRPEEFVRWYAPDTYPRGDDPRKREANWGEIASVIRTQGADGDRVLFEEALLRWELLNMGANPSGEGITQIHEDDLRVGMFTPKYHAGLCAHTFSHGVFVQRALLGELAKLGPHPEEWLAWNATFAQVAASLIEEARPAMEEWVSLRRQERARRAGHGGHRA